MEEILQSIKRIIAEEGTPEPAGSDVLELTDMLGDDEVDVPMHDAPAIPTMSIDEIMAAPLASGPAPTAPAPEPVPEPAPAADPFDSLPEPEPAVPAPAPAAVAPPASKADESLVSETTLNAAVSAMNVLKNIPDSPVAGFVASGVGFRSGTTIEDLVLEALRPMLKEWLDANLAGLVTSLVEKEIRKLSARS